MPKSEEGDFVIITEFKGGGWIYSISPKKGRRILGGKLTTLYPLPTPAESMARASEVLRDLLPLKTASPPPRSGSEIIYRHRLYLSVLQNMQAAREAVARSKSLCVEVKELIG